MQTFFTAGEVIKLDWIKNPAKLRNKAGVYLVTDKASKKLLYIGQSNNLMMRMFPSIHPIYRRELHNLYVLFEPDIIERKRMECRFIELLKPAMNRRSGIRIKPTEELAQEYYDRIFGGNW